MNYKIIINNYVVGFCNNKKVGLNIIKEYKKHDKNIKYKIEKVVKK